MVDDLAQEATAAAVSTLRAGTARHTRAMVTLTTEDVLRVVREEVSQHASLTSGRLCEVQFARAIDLYLEDMHSAGRVNSERTDRSYRGVLDRHAEDVGNRDPRSIGRDDCKRTLARWANPNTQRTARAILVSFYDWTVEEGIRPANPARQTRRPKPRPTSVYRLTRGEATQLLDACQGTQETRAIHLGLCAGLRSAELRGLQGRHFERDGFIWVSADIAKGGRERYVPIVEELYALVDEILSTVGGSHYVLTATRWADPPFNTRRHAVPEKPMAAKPLWELVRRVGERAGISQPIHPHLLRHAFGDHIARHGGLHVAQAMLGHADVRTTRGYTNAASLDELAVAVRGLRYGSATSQEIAATTQR